MSKLHYANRPLPEGRSACGIFSPITRIRYTIWWDEVTCGNCVRRYQIVNRRLSLPFWPQLQHPSS